MRFAQSMIVCVNKSSVNLNANKAQYFAICTAQADLSMSDTE